MSACQERRQALLPAANVVLFLSAVVINGISSENDRYHLTPASNSGIRASHPTAFTPAGFTFSIWGIIFAAGGLCVLYQALPSTREWSVSKIGHLLLLNFSSNIVWLLVYGQGNKSQAALWAALAVLTAGQLGSLIALHRSLRVHYGSTEASWKEKVCVHLFVSVFLGWSLIACCGNITVAFTPQGRAVSDGGLSAHIWSVLLQVIVLAIGGLLCIRGDYVVAMPITWALAGIAAKQRSAEYDAAENVATNAIVHAVAMGLCMIYSALVAHGAVTRHWPFYSPEDISGTAPSAPVVDSSDVVFKPLKEVSQEEEEHV